jgi:CspA family cold shock protein
MTVVLFLIFLSNIQIEGEYPLPLVNYYTLYIMSNGTVKFFNNAKGFGFITPEDGGKDLFVHKNGLSDDITEGDKVSFDVEESPKGLNAVNVRLD